tara:strand:- start:4366 stop:4845 length:480 start_codon:yes stop_codon:yes gene_type:complete
MDELIKTLPSDESKFINENIENSTIFYNKVLEIKNTDEAKIIRCKNGKERKMVHIFAYLLNLYHASHRACEPNYTPFMCLYNCSICNKEAGVGIYKVIGVKVSTKPIDLRRIDYRHQKKFINLYNLDKINKRIEKGDDDNIPDWIIKKKFKQTKLKNQY